MAKYYQLTIVTKENYEAVSEVSLFYIDKDEALRKQDQILEVFNHEPDGFGGYCFIDEISFKQLKDYVSVSHYEKLIGVEIKEPNKWKFFIDNSTFVQLKNQVTITQYEKLFKVTITESI